ncbi:23S rRNA (uracil(1939)-C(5))-methyltransferase RlmD [Alkalibacter saccharofermentans]|uniref:23S rRNA (Uracil1939-C5)-methyltransferase n=1 Tax=Alkalibacter saccharofermentans DSM 14828 TaxID=1120975 RepID=A0A1M4WC02_9FIRM|nr:23S rRNA (uracil(1939)-C(5))-methyltransferase RlmD [Alkalibacter saccharofermentans]SHE78492.1 23S rRNA (uracil1939-C5)-methyltransferase [Alkalibacter saccharofermentans DSM 14828]
MNKGSYKKNQIVNLNIEDLTSTGEGIGKIDGYAVFVDGCLPGDYIKARLKTIKKTYAIGELEMFHKSSKERVEPPCLYFDECGGCQIQNLNYTKQLELKKKIVLDAMTRIGGFDESDIRIFETIGMEEPYGYRNKAQYKVSVSKKIGFYKKRSHHIIPLEKCLIQKDDGAETLKVLNAVITKFGLSVYDENTGKGVLKGIVERISGLNGEIMIILVINADNLENDKKIAEFIMQNIPDVKSIYININKGRSNRVMGYENKLVYGKEKLTDAIGNVAFEISPLSFFQINSEMTKVIYDKVAEYSALKGTETVFDLYCGMGTIGLFLAKAAKEVYGIEIIRDAIEDAQINSKLNKVDNALFIQGKAEEKIYELLDEGKRAEVYVLDPPRKGCDEKLLEVIKKTLPAKIVYVSCNPSTLARDLKILSGEYKIEKVQPIDNFPHSMHVETVTLLVRK